MNMDDLLRDDDESSISSRHSNPNADDTPSEEARGDDQDGTVGDVSDEGAAHLEPVINESTGEPVFFIRVGPIRQHAQRSFLPAFTVACASDKDCFKAGPSNRRDEEPPVEWMVLQPTSTVTGKRSPCHSSVTPSVEVDVPGPSHRDPPMGIRRSPILNRGEDSSSTPLYDLPGIDKWARQTVDQNRPSTSAPPIYAEPEIHPHRTTEGYYRQRIREMTVGDLRMLLQPYRSKILHVDSVLKIRHPCGDYMQIPLGELLHALGEDQYVIWGEYEYRSSDHTETSTSNLSLSEYSKFFGLWRSPVPPSLTTMPKGPPILPINVVMPQSRADDHVQLIQPYYAYVCESLLRAFDEDETPVDGETKPMIPPSPPLPPDRDIEAADTFRLNSFLAPLRHFWPLLMVVAFVVGGGALVLAAQLMVFQPGPVVPTDPTLTVQLMALENGRQAFRTPGQKANSHLERDPVNGHQVLSITDASRVTTVVVFEKDDLTQWKEGKLTPSAAVRLDGDCRVYSAGFRDLVPTSFSNVSFCCTSRCTKRSYCVTCSIVSDGVRILKRTTISAKIPIEQCGLWVFKSNETNDGSISLFCAKPVGKPHVKIEGLLHHVDYPVIHTAKDFCTNVDHDNHFDCIVKHFKLLNPTVGGSVVEHQYHTNGSHLSFCKWSLENGGTKFNSSDTGEHSTCSALVKTPANASRFDFLPGQNATWMLLSVAEDASTFRVQQFNAQNGTTIADSSDVRLPTTTDEATRRINSFYMADERTVYLLIEGNPPDASQEAEVEVLRYKLEPLSSST